MFQCISTLFVLGVVVLALLIMTRAVSVEQAIQTFRQAFVFLVLALWAIFALRGLLGVALLALKSLAMWIVTLGIVLIGIAFLVGVISKVSMRLRKNSRQEGNHE